MKLLKTCKKDKSSSTQVGLSRTGFSILELLVVLSIAVLVLSYGSFLSSDFFKSYFFIAEEKMLLTLLRTARARAQSNLGGVPHGLFVGSQNFILFQGQNFEENVELNEIYPRNENVEIESSFENSQVVFQNISARTVFAGEFRVLDEARETLIRIDQSGRID